MPPPTHIHVGSIGGGTGGDGGPASGGSGGRGGIGEAPRLSIRQFLNNAHNIIINIYPNISDSLHAVDEALNGISIASRVDSEGLRNRHGAPGLGYKSVQPLISVPSSPAPRKTTATPNGNNARLPASDTPSSLSLSDAQHSSTTEEVPDNATPAQTIEPIQAAINFVISFLAVSIGLIAALLVGRNPAHGVETLPAPAATPTLSETPPPATSDPSAHTTPSQSPESPSPTPPADDEFDEEVMDETAAAQRRAAKGKARARTDHTASEEVDVAAADAADVAAAIAASRLPDRTTQGASTSRREDSSGSPRLGPIDTSSARVSAAATVGAAAGGTTAGAAAPPIPVIVQPIVPDAAPVSPAGPPPVQAILLIFYKN
ncbi:hypothetical protein B0H11DRAFT_323113 [Mycena galericulata]|nr:hypothetical protein B0H11DRAFT_323113 [Mycena galericulata]